MLRSDTLVAKPDGVIWMTEAELFELPEYSTSLPNGMRVGRRWRRDVNFWARRTFAHLHFWDGTPEPEDDGVRWVVAEYLPDPEPGHFAIKWLRVVLIA
jgi:8-oxo-dGTP pyrophosphatase MutT (NUDIX family)